MSHGRPPRRPRYAPRSDVFTSVLKRATRHTAAEIEQLMAPVDRALSALRKGVATEAEWYQLGAAIEVSQAIEAQGVVRGLREHLSSAERALAGIRARAMDSGEWHPTALYYQELDDVSEAIRLHRFQLEQVSAGELAKAYRRADNQVHQAGGIFVSMEQLRIAA